MYNKSIFLFAKFSIWKVHCTEVHNALYMSCKHIDQCKIYPICYGTYIIRVLYHMYLCDIFGDTYETANDYCLRFILTEVMLFFHFSTISYNAGLWKMIFLAIKFPNYTYTYMPINFSHRLISNTYLVNGGD